jgi:hypothetical protein
MEGRFVTGGFTEIGPAIAWMRMRVPLVEGEAVHPVARIVIAADSGNGLAGALDYAHWIFVNPDLTVHVHREPVGEWVCLDGRSTIERHGVGLAETTIFDAKGAVARGLQSLYVAPREA